jgi:hypothetical protein
MTFWREERCVGDVLELYNLVTPESDRSDQKGLSEFFGDRYRIYTYRNHFKKEKDLVSLMIICHLKLTHTTHFEIIAIHPKYRQRGLAIPLFKSFLLTLEHDKLPHQSLSIEAYLHNVDFFTRKLGFQNPNITYTHSAQYRTSPFKFLCFHPKNATAIANEWIEFAKSWPPHLENPTLQKTTTLFTSTLFPSKL